MDEGVVNPEDFLEYVKSDKPGAAMGWLRRHNGDVNHRYEGGWTALMHAADNGGRRVTGYLLDAGADVNAQNDEGKTALIIAAEADEQYEEIVEALLDHGADVDIQDIDGNTAEMVATPEVQEMIAEYRAQHAPEPPDDAPMDYGAARRRKTRRKVGKKKATKKKATKKTRGTRRR